MRVIQLFFILLLGLEIAGCTSDSTRPGFFCTAGTESVNALMDAWSKRIHWKPATTYFHEGRGNEFAVDVLLKGKCDFVIMDRPMTEDELARISEKTGQPPRSIPLATEGLSIVATRALATMYPDPNQIRDLFTGEAAVSDPIEIYALEKSSSISGWFRSNFLNEKEYGERVHEKSGSLSILETMESKEKALGFVRSGDLPSDISLVVLLSENSFPEGKNPLQRTISIYSLPSEAASPNSRQFLKAIQDASFRNMLPHFGFQPIPRK